MGKINFLVVTVTGILFVFCQKVMAETGSCKVYYVPFNVATYVPLLKSQIAKDCSVPSELFLCFKMSRTQSIRQLFAEISEKNLGPESSKSTVDVRVKIVCDQSDFPVYIDTQKRIHTDDRRYLVKPKLVDKVIVEVERAARSCRKELKKAGKEKRKTVPCYLEK